MKNDQEKKIRLKILQHKGHVEILGFRLFYRIFEPKEGERPRGTLVCLHGGPGATHDYLLPLADLAKKEFGYKVVFYDQLGCGKSEVPKNYALFSVERGVEELEEFRKKMKLGKIHLMGSSYGGMLALAYALKYQRNLKSLITTGGLASVPLCVAEMNRLKRNLPKRVLRTLEKYEERGEYHNPEYERAVMVFYRKHLLRMKKWPKEQEYTLRHMSHPVYHTMNGPNEFTIIGNTKYYDITSRLDEIHVPTLVTGGRYDEVTPKVARSIHDNIKGSKLVIFPKSSHLAFWEEREKYMNVVYNFLESV
jgi:proline iminopeptidase